VLPWLLVRARARDFIVGLRSKLLSAADERSGSAAIASDAFKDPRDRQRSRD